MTTWANAAALALALPEATMADHQGIDSFRVRGRIFATVPDDAHIRIMVDPVDITAAVAEYPDACAPFYWGPACRAWSSRCRRRTSPSSGRS